MALLRRFGNVVNSKAITAANPLLLKNDWRIKLSAESEPSIGHVYALPGLYWHLHQLERHGETRKEQWLQSSINHDRRYLDLNLERHVINAVKYAQSGAELTAQAIADLYSVKSSIKATDAWFDTYVNPKLNEKLPFLSIQNIYSILHALKGTESPIVDNLIAELEKREQQEYDLVDYDHNQSTQYKYVRPSSQQDVLLSSCAKNQFRLIFWFKVLNKHFRDWIYDFAYRPDEQYSNFRLSQPHKADREDVKKLLGEFNWNKQAQTLLQKL